MLPVPLKSTIHITLGSSAHGLSISRSRKDESSRGQRYGASATHPSRRSLPSRRSRDRYNPTERKNRELSIHPLDHDGARTFFPKGLKKQMQDKAS